MINTGQQKNGVDILDANKYVSRGGLKLHKALETFDVSPQSKICLDCGASTGGFTDCLLQNGAKLIYAIDVGYGQLAWELRKDSRVIVMERTNIRYVTADDLISKRTQGDGPVVSDNQETICLPEFVVLDVSFISLALVLPVIAGLVDDKCEVVSLIKPQFEAGKDKVGKNGVVKDKSTHIEVLGKFISDSEGAGFTVRAMTHSPIKGPKGNIEYFGWLSNYRDEATAEKITINPEEIVEEAHRCL